MKLNKKMNTLSKALLGVVIFLLFCSFSSKKQIIEIPSVYGIIHIEEDSIVFVIKSILFSPPYTLVGYDIKYDESEEKHNVYITLKGLLGTNNKSAPFELKTNNNGDKELIIPKTDLLTKENLHFYYKSYDECYELKVE